MCIISCICQKIEFSSLIDGTETKEVEALSFKKAVKSYQGSSKAKMITIEWMTKGGEVFVKDQKITTW